MQSPGRTVQAAGRARRTSSVALRRGHHERTESRRGRAGPQGRARVRTAAESGSARRSLGKVRRAGTRSGAHLRASPRWPPRLDFSGESPRNGVFTSQGTERTLHRLSRGRASVSWPGAHTASDADAAGPSGPPAAPPSRPVTLRPRPPRVDTGLPHSRRLAARQTASRTGETQTATERTRTGRAG